MLGIQDVVTLGLVGGALSLDRTAFLQSMASRPLVGATLGGYVLGEPALGLLCGLLLELLWLMDLPIGAAVPPDEALGGVLSAVFAVAAPAAWSFEARAALGVLLALPFGWLGRMLDVVIRRWNGRLLERARFAVAQGRPDGLGRAHLLGGVRFFAAGVAATAAGAVMGSGLVGELTRRLPAGVATALELTEATLPFLGAAAVLAALRGFRHTALFGAGLLGSLGAGRHRELLEFLSRGPWRR
jgi:PTS system mannose-specific IIC component/fructoselysine and glucoselysine-specific PTS system IIC component